jgi:hypothetical protein
VISGFAVGGAVGLLVVALALGYAHYLRARRPDKLRGPWARLVGLTHTPKRAALYLLGFTGGWLAGIVVVDRLGLGTLPRDDQNSLLLLLLTVAVLALGAFVVWTRAPERS